MIGSAEVLRALRAHGTIAWFRISAGVDPLDSLVRPPWVVWRYADPQDRVRLAIPPAVETFEGNVEWVADVSAENWYLEPRRVRDELSGAAPGYPGVLSDLKHGDQDFCIRATQDLELLLARIERLHD
ncbi:hypothetical protein OOK36_26905 [Streptomyces sp. NBC_00365]|uniref:hypothetical protein n=1 Tax=Streptomyces sp. NBC_00365 TaxID=2975726 RepID=UPI002255D66A|nr:hypothetical protein [Streptomyces sp. NBC_00365]MCX5092443.1 hypothetical protein [Streptomyces sp. NBC_00365]